MRLTWLLTVCLVCCSCGIASAFQANGPSKAQDWRHRRMELEREFQTELQPISAWCLENEMSSEAAETADLFLERDPERQYIYLPSEQSAAITSTDDLRGQWLEKTNAAKVAHAARILELAKLACQQDAPSVSFQLLHEVIHYDLDHLEVRKMLGHRKLEDGWKVASDSIRIRPDTRAHDVIGWPAKGYIRVLTPHFNIESNASELRTRHLAQQLEQAQLVWRQVFFDYWGSSAALRRWISGDGSVRSSNKRFRVVFFRDKNDYVKELSPNVRGIEASSGYYNNQQEISFFFDGDETIESNWRHELTHQLFRESGRSNKKAFETQFIWLDEGIATYFESMKDFGSYVTLGGFDSRRNQYARHQGTVGTKPLPTSQLSTLGRTDLQQRTDMARIYSQSAALVDMLMNDNGGALESPLSQFLEVVYRGRVKKGAFEKTLGRSFAQLDQQYQTHLQVDSEQIEHHLLRPESRTELSLPSANLSAAAFESIGRCTRLTWLDLAGNSVREDNLKSLVACQRLNQLFLNGCRFEQGSLRPLSQFPLLAELDLSGSTIQDAQLSTFATLRNLQSLRLAGTAITDEGLGHLENVTNLRWIDLSGTKVTNQGIVRLQMNLPDLDITK